MIAPLKGFPGSGNFARGVHPPGRKEMAAEAAIEVLPAPAQIAIPLLQHTGAACEPLVKLKDTVALGQKVGDSTGFIS